MEELPTYAVLQTPPGRGAIAVIVVAGPRAVSAVDAHFLAANGKPLAAQPANAIRFGHWGSATGEEVVVCRRTDFAHHPPPPSAGEGVLAHSAIPGTLWVPQSAFVEVHCHGGHAAAAAIIADLRASGCQILNWPEWLRLVADPLAAEAHIALAAALTERTAAILLDQYHGDLARAVRAIVSAIESGNLKSAAGELDALLSRAPVGLHLTAPWRVVVAGPPNVGKSSLINALVGFGRSIVFDQPGTTRDVVTVRTAIDGWPIELADTAGLRTTGDPLESAGVDLATKALESADLVVLVSDATQPADVCQIPSRPQQRSLLVRNKIDLVPILHPPPPSAGEGLGEGGSQNWDRLLAASVPAVPPVIDTSAKTGAGIEMLLAAIARTLAPQPPEPGAAVPFTWRHQAALERARDAVAAGDSSTAATLLQALLAGQSVSKFERKSLGDL